MLAERGVNGSRSHYWLLCSGAHYCQGNIFRGVSFIKIFLCLIFFFINKVLVFDGCIVGCCSIDIRQSPRFQW